MKKKYLWLALSLVVLLSVILVWVTTNRQAKPEKEVTKVESSKTLIVYYSRTGNTKAVADIIQNQVGGDLFQIETKEARPENYRTEVNQNEQEQDDNVLSELKNQVANSKSYDRIFIGAPTWDMALPQAVVTFLESYDFAGKTVIPFNTHGGYGAGSVFTQIKDGAKGANVLKGLSIHGGEETNGILLAIKGNKKVAAEKEVSDWLKEIKIN